MYFACPEALRIFATAVVKYVAPAFGTNFANVDCFEDDCMQIEMEEGPVLEIEGWHSAREMPRHSTDAQEEGEDDDDDDEADESI